MAVSFSYRIRGIEPFHDPAWRAAPDAVRRAFWKEVVKIGLEVKDHELSEGLDKNGQEMIAISRRTRENRRSAMGPADPNAPPLQPAYGLSRTRSLLAGRAFNDHAEFFWRFDDHTQASWGRILNYHRRGKGRLPVRDVIGLSPKGVAEVERRAQRWWFAHKDAIDLKDANKRPMTIPIEAVVRPTVFKIPPAIAMSQPVRVVPIAGTKYARVYSPMIAPVYHTKAAGNDSVMSGWYQKRRVAN